MEHVECLIEWKRVQESVPTLPLTEADLWRDFFTSSFLTFEFSILQILAASFS